MSSGEVRKLGERYASHVGIKLSTLGVWTVNDGKFFPRLELGGDCRTRTAVRLVQWFSDNWPEDLAWPEGVKRPPPRPAQPPKSKVA